MRLRSENRTRSTCMAFDLVIKRLHQVRSFSASKKTATFNACATDDPLTTMRVQRRAPPRMQRTDTRYAMRPRKHADSRCAEPQATGGWQPVPVHEAIRCRVESVFPD